MSSLSTSEIITNYWRQAEKHLKGLEEFIQSKVIVEEKRDATSSTSSDHNLDKILKTYMFSSHHQQSHTLNTPNVEFLTTFQTKYKDHANIVTILSNVIRGNKDIIKKQEDIDKVIKEQTDLIMLHFSTMVRTSIEQLMNSKKKVLMPIINDYNNQCDEHLKRIRDDYNQVHEPAIKQTKVRFYKKFTTFLENKTNILHDMYCMAHHFLTTVGEEEKDKQLQQQEEELSSRLQESLEILKSLSVLINRNTVNDLPTPVVQQAYEQLSEFVTEQEKLLCEIVMFRHESSLPSDPSSSNSSTTVTSHNNNNNTQREMDTEEEWNATLLGLRTVDPIHYQLYKSAASHVEALVNNDKRVLSTHMSKQTSIDEMIKALDRQVQDISKTLHVNTTNNTAKLQLKEFQNQRQRLIDARESKTNTLIKQTQASLKGNESALKAWTRFLDHIHQSCEQWFVKDHDEWESLLQEEHKLHTIWRSARVTHIQKLDHIKHIMKDLQEQEVSYFESDAKLHQQQLFHEFLMAFQTAIALCVTALDKQHTQLTESSDVLDYAVTEIQSYDVHANQPLPQTQILFSQLNPLKTMWSNYIFSHSMVIFQQFTLQFENRYDEYIKALRVVIRGG